LVQILPRPRELELVTGVGAVASSQRYEHASTIITSNRDLTEWAPLFNDPLLTSAAMDRLLHHSHIIEITGSSYRNPPRGPKAKAA
jgi:DNA replication protein DnaC